MITAGNNSYKNHDENGNDDDVNFCTWGWFVVVRLSFLFMKQICEVAWMVDICQHQTGSGTRPEWTGMLSQKDPAFFLCHTDSTYFFLSFFLSFFLLFSFFFFFFQFLSVFFLLFFFYDQHWELWAVIVVVIFVCMWLGFFLYHLWGSRYVFRDNEGSTRCFIGHGLSVECQRWCVSKSTAPQR